MTSLDDRFAHGLALHQQGRFSDAETIYREVLQREPGHFDALHLSGVVALQTGRAALAVERITEALSIKPAAAIACSNLGNASRSLGRHHDALESYDKAISLNPAFAEAYVNRGNTLQSFNRYQDAVASYDRAMVLKPSDAGASLSRGNALQELDCYQEAVASYDEAIALNPDYAETHVNRTNALLALARHPEALESHDKPISLKSDDAEVYFRKRNVLRDLKRHEAALENYDRAIALKPDYAEAYSNRGNSLQALSRFEAALESYDHAIALKPDFAEVYSNRGLVLHSLEQYRAALASYDRAIALMPEFASAFWNKGRCLLQLGEFEEGWRLFKWRKELNEPVANRSYTQPLWLGQESLEGKTLFLHAEQGLGDTLQFCRYAKMARACGALVVMSVQDPLVRLLATMDPAIPIIGGFQEPIGFDYHCPLMSLPSAMGTTLKTIPSSVPYLHADPEQSAAWCRRLAALSGLKVGLVWAGAPRRESPVENAVDRRRSMTLQHYAPLAAIPGLCLITLQKGEPAAQVGTPPAGIELHDWTDELTDFADTAALVDALDLVISVDTSVVHLAGAMGKPVWVLNRFDQCWRWLTDRRDSPWYPTARLFRQRESGNWSTVLDEVKHELINITSERYGNG